MVRERLVDLRLKGSGDVNVASHRAAMQAALGDGFTTSCVASLSSRQVQCVLDATSYDAAEACSHDVAAK
jgi:hypothetical protein